MSEEFGSPVEERRTPSPDAERKGRLPARHRSGFVTLFGRSNVGKSTLLNRLVGEKVSIVTSTPQTTRRSIRGIRTYPDAQVVYMDTPGIHKPRFAMNRRMVSAAIASLDGMDLILMIVDGAAGLGPGDRYAMELIQKREMPAFLVINKIDLMKPEQVMSTIAEATDEFTFREVVPVSALDGEGIEKLEMLIPQNLPQGNRVFPEDVTTDVPEKFLMAEILREKVILNTRQELPHSTAVVVERFEERKAGLLEIDALILVERIAQKGILIGRDGEMMKKIASEARREMETRIDTKVFLRAWVKVAKNWRRDGRMLDRLGVEGEDDYCHPDSAGERPRRDAAGAQDPPPAMVEKSPDTDSGNSMSSKRMVSPDSPDGTST